MEQIRSGEKWKMVQELMNITLTGLLINILNGCPGETVFSKAGSPGERPFIKLQVLCMKPRKRRFDLAINPVSLFPGIQGKGQ
jgi:hypothetical protein